MSTIYHVPKVHFGKNSLSELSSILDNFKNNLIIIDKNLINHASLNILKNNNFSLISVDTSTEPSVDYVDELSLQVRNIINLECVVGIGGGSSLDIAKALANLYTNPGSAALYQGWDLLNNPSLYTVGIPTLPGTGAESSKTCVLLNKVKNLKLGMNSQYSVFKEVICDSNLLKSIPKNLFFYTVMDAFFHCMELLNGFFRSPFSDAYAQQALKLIDDIFSSDDPMSDVNLEKAMLASFLGGSAIANSYVGIIHPLSAGLSTVFGTPHSVANCIVMQAMEEYYPKEYNLFMSYKEKNNYTLPTGITKNLSNEEYLKLYQSSICHQKPLINALGEDFENILTLDKVVNLFKMM
ncbi:iron-containing alcohol dehydrogenase family protein [Silvanigrella aquatica]|uniref:Uncharacterized protein n=1 Tax=Silvanigrella aquatica TaxID=1915309 RepID=A0A1L4D306_9BACT|nr:iron-containing alcohol dehydrogenase family protein [Silvanigrella aquatica]APJ04572.1 hypothetical protein AXG55_11910 [Silvanigrella aquatica]